MSHSDTCPDSPTPGPVVFVHAPNRPTSRWYVEVREFARFRDALGADILCAFACCFVHADRLVSLTSFALRNDDPPDSPAYSRNLQTIVWFAAGTLRELGFAIRDLRSSLAKAKLLEHESEPWLTLRALEARWMDDEVYREMRNQVAFHVDQEVVARGLARMADAGEPVVVLESIGRLEQGQVLRLGLEAFYQGSDKDKDAFQQFFVTVARDQGAATAIEQVFLRTLELVGMVPVEIAE